MTNFRVDYLVVNAWNRGKTIQVPGGRLQLHSGGQLACDAPSEAGLTDLLPFPSFRAFAVQVCGMTHVMTTAPLLLLLLLLLSVVLLVFVACCAVM